MLCAGFVLVSAMAYAQEPSAQPEPVLETGELMLLVIKPAYDELQKAMQVPPADRQQWAKLYQKAARLAEFENLILFRPHQRAETPEWKTFAANARRRSHRHTCGTARERGWAGMRSPISVHSGTRSSCSNPR